MHLDLSKNSNFFLQSIKIFIMGNIKQIDFLKMYRFLATLYQKIKLKIENLQLQCFIVLYT